LKNLVDEQPTRDLHGRLAWSRSFVDSADCTGRDILDIGCGFGWFELLALDRDARAVTGIEPTTTDLATVREHLDDERLTFTVASALALPFEDESFDTVVCWEVLEHLPKDGEPQAFQEIRRVLRPDGALYLSTPHAALLPKLTDPAWWLIGHRHYSRERLAGFAEDAGLEVERLEAKGRSWEIVQTLNLYVAKWIFRRRPFFEAAITRNVDIEWERPGFSNLFLRARKPLG
jgi:ubiquinone/menaquinone biosynthesis C-methylase UbiE